MALAPGTAEQRARLRGDLRIGLGVVLIDGAEAALVLAAETLKPGRFGAFLSHARDPVLAVTARRAATLHARAYDGDIARLRLREDAGPDWVRAVSDPAADLMSPMKGPFTSAREGNARLHRAAITLCKEARLLPAALVGTIADGAGFAVRHGLQALEVVEGAGARQDSALQEVAAARVPLELSRAGRLHVFRPDDGGEEHYAIEIGHPDRAHPVLARLHSACFTGDLLHSLKCDCGPQLRSALDQIGRAEGGGVLLYLNQEGRGIGLANKMRAYALQDQGFDTVEANHRLGFEDDERDFRLGAEILTALGFRAARLMTNNPRKVTMMTEAGLAVVERVPLKVGRNAENAAYLETKAKKSGHLL